MATLHEHLYIRDVYNFPLDAADVKFFALG
jgi:hypothetical protein